MEYISLQIGTTLRGGTYRIDEVLGQGGFGITYLATDLSLDKHVAIKEFFPKDYCDRDSTTSCHSLLPSLRCYPTSGYDTDRGRPGIPAFHTQESDCTYLQGHVIGTQKPLSHRYAVCECSEICHWI